jgi:hypothetical protein
MRANLLPRILVAVAALAVIAGVWLLPRVFTSGATEPPPAIELRADRTPAASPGASAEPQTVDDGAAAEDDADDRAQSRREEPRSNRESVPQPDDGDDDDDRGVDDDDDGDDDVGDDDD